MKNITTFKNNKQPTSYIIANPLKQQFFTFKEYQNWNLVSPKFTSKEYKEYCQMKGDFFRLNVNIFK